MAYTWNGMRKLSWKEVQKLHKEENLVNCFKLYDDNTEALIEKSYTWEEIEEHYNSGGEFGKEIGG